MVDERHLLAINYTSGTTGRPKGVMYHHRGAYLQARRWRFTRDSARVPVPVDAADVPLQRLVLHLGGHRGRRRHVCLRPDPAEIWRLLRAEGITHFSAAPTVLTMIAEDPAARPSSMRCTWKPAARRRRRPCWPGGKWGSR